MFGHKFSHLHTQNPTQTIHQAVSSKNIRAVTDLLAANVDPNLQDKDGNTPLHLFAYLISDEDSDTIAKILLKKGADPNIYNKENDTPLHIIALDNSEVNIAVAKLLLDNGADPNLEDQRGRTPLLIAARRKNPQMVEVILASEKTVVDLQDNHRRTALFHAVALENYFYREEENIVEDTNYLDTSDTFSIVRTLLLHGADPNFQDEDGNAPLHSAVLMGCYYEAEILINYGADVNLQNKAGETPLYIAVVLGESKIVELLLDHGADVNIECHQGYTPFYLAATGSLIYGEFHEEYRPLLQMVKLLLDKKGDSIDWKDEAYRKKLWGDIRDKKIKELLIPTFQKITMWELWIMKTQHYASYFQWLPRELVEDMQSSFFSKEYIVSRKRKAAEEECENAKSFCQDLLNFSYSP